MHYIPAYESAVTLFSRAGDVWAFRNKREAVKELGLNWISKHVGAHYRECTGMRWKFEPHLGKFASVPTYEDSVFIMRDDAGKPVTYSTLQAELPRRPYVPYWRRHLESWHGTGPVPGTAKSKAGKHYYRRPKTMSELRAAALVLTEEGEVAPRARRTKRYLPTSWDDVYIAARHVKNWKRQRKTRWKA